MAKKNTQRSNAATDLDDKKDWAVERSVESGTVIGADRAKSPPWEQRPMEILP